MRVAIVYNEPRPSRYDAAGEEKAVTGVLQAVEAVRRALLELGHGVACVPLAPPSTQARNKLRSLKADLVFNLFEGFCGRPETEAMVPEALAEMGMPCTGCPGRMLRLALDKAKVKVLLKAAGIPTPDFQLLNHHMLHMFHLSYPCLVKPRSEDASHGLTEKSLVTDSASLQRQVKLITRTYGGNALLEEFIDGREFNATVLGDSRCSVLPVSEIAYELPPGMPRILTFAAKWEPDSQYFQGTRAVCPAQIEAGVRERIEETALAAFRLLGGQGYARVDMRLNQEGQPSVIEVNPNPDISPGSGAVRQAEAADMSYPQFIDKIIQLALKKGCHEDRDTSDAAGRQAGPDEDTAQYARIQCA